MNVDRSKKNKSRLGCDFLRARIKIGLRGLSTLSEFPVTIPLQSYSFFIKLQELAAEIMQLEASFLIFFRRALTISVLRCYK